MDAVLIVALGQTVLAAGCWDSFAGILSLLFFDARSQEVYALNAGYNSVQGENRPLTIPCMGTPSGRTALVPGFMGGIGAAHARFGSLPFYALFEPAIGFAENGFRINQMLGRLISFRADTLLRLPETKRIFLKDGKLLRQGDILRQPQLAMTLQQTAQGGIEFMYTGTWGRHFVEALAQSGSKITPADLQSYEARWNRPVETSYRRCRVCAPALPGMGGVYLAEALNLLTASAQKWRHYAEAADSLYWLIQITRARCLPSFEDPAKRAERESAERLWHEMYKHGGLSSLDIIRVFRRLVGHSDGALAFDRWGNVAALCHSANTLAWGTTGIFVDGVSIPDSASFQQPEIASVGPGARLPDPMNPVIVLHDGIPLFASVAIGGSLHELTVQNLVNLLDFGMTPSEAVDAPHFLGPDWPGILRPANYKNRYVAVFGKTVSSLLTKAAMLLPHTCRRTERHTIEKGRFSPELIEGVRALGQPVREIDPDLVQSFWAGLRIQENGSVASAGGCDGLGGAGDHGSRYPRASCRGAAARQPTGSPQCHSHGLAENSARRDGR
jgi:gamma-glutamyltranspeptidase/glutathione hydrolase